MSRPYYALAALVAALTGTALAVGPANCQRSACVRDLPACLSQVSWEVDYASAEHVIDNNVGSDADATEEAFFSDNTQGSGLVCGENSTYEGSCGRDALSGEVYDYGDYVIAQPNVERDYEFDGLVEFWSGEVNYWSLYNNVADQTVESWPADERLEVCMPTYHEEDQAFSPYADPTPALDYVDYWSLYKDDADQVALNGSADYDCGEDAFQVSKSDQDVAELLAKANAWWNNAHAALSQVRESEDWDAITDWRVAKPESCPWWIDTYADVDDSIESQYAEAEVAAAREAAMMGREDLNDPAINYAPATPDHVAYDEEYQSQYELALSDENVVDEQAIIDGDDSYYGYDNGQADSQRQLEEGRTVLRFRDLINRVRGVIEQIVPVIEDNSDEVLKSAMWLLSTVPDESFAAAAEDDVFADYASLKEYDELMREALSQRLEVRQDVDSSEVVASLINGLRTAGNFMVSAADRLQDQWVGGSMSVNPIVTVDE